MGGRFTNLQTVYGPSLSLSYLLLDFGGRAGDVEEARQSLLASDWTHNAAIQDVVLETTEAYYGYLDAKAQLEAAQATLKEAETNLEAAERRHDVGVATIADVLQARTALSQARLVAQTIEGRIQSLKGALATSMGVPASTLFEVGDLPESVPAAAITQEVDRAIERAVGSRPDLAAARSRVLEAEAHARSVRSESLPTFSLSSGANRAYYDPKTFASSSDNWSVGLVIRFPLFTGFESAYNLNKARSEAKEASARAEGLEQQAILEVWTSYYDLKTAAQRVGTAGDLLDSATQSELVALARYKEGVGTLPDLLIAQSALALARAQEIRARSDWLVAVARLARNTGTLAPTGQATGDAPSPWAGKETEEHATP